MRHRTAALLLVAAVVALAVILLTVRLVGSQGAAGGEGPMGPPPPLVEVAEATVRPIEITARAVGSVEAAESIVVSSPVTGTVQRLEFREGQQVQRGAPLVELDASAELAAFEAAQAELKDARSQLQRLSRLAGSGAVSQSTLDEAKARTNTARAQVDERRAEIDDRRIRAPFSGTVGLALVSPGAVVQPGDPITHLATVGQLKLSFRLPARTLPSLRLGLPVRGSIPGVKEFHGQVTRIDNAVDPETRSIALEAGLGETGSIKPGMFVAVDVVLDRYDAVAVPEAAVLLEGEQTFVYEVGRDNIALRRPVTIGQRRAGFAEVRRGLSVGARVITAGAQKVKPGQPVTLPRKGGQTGGAAS